MSARSQMTLRCDIFRDEQATEDEWGHEAPADMQAHLVAVPCATWYGAEKEAVDVERTAVVEDRRIIFPVGTDVTAADEVRNIRNKNGDIILQGSYGIESVGQREDHLAAVLTGVRSS